MRVKYIGHDKSTETGESARKSRFTANKVYLVLGINYCPDREPTFWILMDDRRAPVFKGVSFFEIVEERIPANWGVKSLPAGGFEIVPIELLQNKFSLEAFFDRKPEELVIFERVVAKLEAEGF